MTSEKSIQAALPFASDSQVRTMADEYGTRLYVHDENSYRRYGREALAAPNAFGLSVRYAMKANPHRGGRGHHCPDWATGPGHLRQSV